MQSHRLLYLGHAFPPGVSALFPELQPAGHLIETHLIQSVSSSFDLRSVGISRVDIAKLGKVEPASPGLPNALHLLDRPPSVWNRMRSLHRLRRTYSTWLTEGWCPDLIVVCNFSPVYNAFIRRLARQKVRPRLVLFLADSASLGTTLPALKRLRYQLKPFKYLESDMVRHYDACVAMSRQTEAYFTSQGQPWLWHPGGCDPTQARKPSRVSGSKPLVFGYFGSLSEYSGIHQLLRVFATSPGQSRLRICGYGKERRRLEQAWSANPRIQFCGPLNPEQCLEFGSECDVLVNPRPLTHGNENNFPSKIYQYGLCGRSILTSGFAGVSTVLGSAAFYFDASNHERSLQAALQEISTLDRNELLRRGLAIQQRLVENYTWERQAQGLHQFLTGLVC